LAPSDEFCIQNGIISQTITLYSYQQNDITECKDQTLKKSDELHANKFRSTPKIIKGCNFDYQLRN
jgi:hypothetical protein